MTDGLRVDVDGPVATLTLDRPEALNALTVAVKVALREALERIAADRTVRVVILTGAGRAFCAGLDLKELGSRDSQPLGAFTDADMMAAIRGFPGPVIGAVNGFAITGGFELALACDLLIASSEARFADTHARVGILPGWGLSQKLPRLIGIGRAKELAFTGNFIGAEQALAWGLVNRVVAPAELLATCRQLAADMLSCDAVSLRGYKQLIDAGFATTFQAGLRLEARASRDHAKAITPEIVATRRGAVQERGRRQTGG